MNLEGQEENFSLKETEEIFFKIIKDENSKFEERKSIELGFNFSAEKPVENSSGAFEWTKNEEGKWLGKKIQGRKCRSPSPIRLPEMKPVKISVSNSDGKRKPQNYFKHRLSELMKKINFNKC